jgi:hypothetical protein
MIGPHAYASNTASRGRVLGYIALVALLITVASTIVINSVLQSEALAKYQSYSWIVSPITVSGAFGLVYLFYDKWLWKYLSRIPDLSGMWVGVWQPNYQPNWPHLGIVSIEQTWAEIFVQVDFFFKESKDEEWSLSKPLGSDKSITAGMTEVSAAKATVSITYLHFGTNARQPDFQGTAFLELRRMESRLEGKYFTNRIDRATGAQGSLGRVAMQRVSREPLTMEQALTKDPDLTRRLECQIREGT